MFFWSHYNKSFPVHFLGFRIAPPPPQVQNFSEATIKVSIHDKKQKMSKTTIW